MNEGTYIRGGFRKGASKQAKTVVVRWAYD